MVLASCGDDNRGNKASTTASTAAAPPFTAGSGTATGTAPSAGEALIAKVEPAVKALDLRHPERLSVDVKRGGGGRFDVTVEHSLGPASPANRARSAAKVDARTIMQALYTGPDKDRLARVIVRSVAGSTSAPTPKYTIVLVGSTGRALDWDASQARIEASWRVVVDRLAK